MANINWRDDEASLEKTAVDKRTEFWRARACDAHTEKYRPTLTDSIGIHGRAISRAQVAMCKSSIL